MQEEGPGLGLTKHTALCLVSADDCRSVLRCRAHAHSWSARQPRQGNYATVWPDMAYKVEAVEAMKRKEGGHDDAMELLKRIAKQVSRHGCMFHPCTHDRVPPQLCHCTWCRDCSVPGP